VNSFSRWLLKFLLIGLLVLPAIYLFFHESDTPPGRFVVFEVQAGESFRSVSKRLFEEELISSDSYFYYLARITGRSAKLKAGEYELNDKMSAWDILKIITGARVKLYKITIKEGMNMFQIAKLLRERGLVDEVQFLEACWDSNFVEDLNIPSFTVEGYLFPETYYIPKGTSSRKIIRMFVDMFWSHIPDGFLEQARRAPLSFHEAIIMASVIEKETGLAAEMSLISSVFYNRLAKGMRLQSDPTAIYDSEPYGGPIKREQLFRKTPFNTYQTAKLPLTPIANPGILAIQASLFPQETDFLFFVSRRDGSHHFSRSYSEHKKAIEKYLKNSLDTSQ